MSRLRNIFGRQISSEGLDVRLGQSLCFGGAPVVLILAARKLSSIPLTEGEAVIGLLASLAVALLLVILGLLLPLARRQRPAQHRRPQPHGGSV